MSDELVRILPFSVDLSKPIENTELHELFVMGDSLAHRFELEITRGSEAVSLSGCTVTGCFTNFAEDTTVKWDGEVKNGKASVTLSDPCYTLHGQFVLTIQISGGGVDASVFCGDGFMRQTKTETIIYDDYVIYDVSTLLSQIGAMKAATEAANTATANANTATGKANTAAQTANTAASGANTARDNANTAAGAANTAAGKIDAMTVSATPVDTGTATAELTTVDGHYHLALGLPKGYTGATPQISVEVQTGAAGSEASVSVTGTAENPVIHLTIPKGDTGNIGALTINGKTPDAGGAVTLGISDISGLSEAIANAGGVKTVAGVSPDSAGNVALNAESVGALDASGTAADSSKLGGKTWAERLLDIYPIGSIYMSVNDASPASLFGGTWEQIEDRFLLAAGSTYAAGSTGGEATHTLTEAEMPSHIHKYDVSYSGVSGSNAYVLYQNSMGNAGSLRTNSVGGGAAHNNMPPYLAVYMWKRVS